MHKIEMDWWPLEVGMRDWGVVVKGFQALVRASMFWRPALVLLYHDLNRDPKCFP